MRPRGLFLVKLPAGRFASRQLLSRIKISEIHAHPRFVRHRNPSLPEPIHATMHVIEAGSSGCPSLPEIIPFIFFNLSECASESFVSDGAVHEPYEHSRSLTPDLGTGQPTASQEGRPEA